MDIIGERNIMFFRGSKRGDCCIEAKNSSSSVVWASLWTRSIHFLSYIMDCGKLLDLK